MFDYIKKIINTENIDRLRGLKKEEIVFAMLSTSDDVDYKLNGFYSMHDGNGTKTACRYRNDRHKKLIETCRKTGTNRLVLIHNHPTYLGFYTSKRPSGTDFLLTNDVAKMISMYKGVELLDHLIFTKKDYYSFMENGYIQVV